MSSVLAPYVPTFVLDNPMLIIALLYIVYKFFKCVSPAAAVTLLPQRYLDFFQPTAGLRLSHASHVLGSRRSKQPWPEVGGNVTTIHSLAEWRELLAKGGLVLVDCYATWCPPCKVTATPCPWAAHCEGTRVGSRAQVPGDRDAVALRCAV